MFWGTYLGVVSRSHRKIHGRWVTTPPRREVVNETQDFSDRSCGRCGCSGCSACGNGNQQGAPASASGGALTIKDVADRTVTLDAAPSKIILGESRQAFSLLFLQKENLLDKVVAWGTDMQTAAPGCLRARREGAIQGE